MVSKEEERLVRKLKARDPRAFEKLILRYQRPVYTLLYRMTGLKEEAEDLAQEVFITVFKKIDTFRGDAALTTWIFRIATNHCRNRQKYLGRRRHFDKRPLDDVSEGQASASRTMSTSAQIARPDELVEGFQMERLIQQAIGALEEEQRLVLVLRDVENLSYDQIAAVTGLAIGTIKSRLHRARMALKDKLAEPER